MLKPLNIFVPHCSELLTDHLPHGDGLIAHASITNLARRGHHLYVVAQQVDLLEPLHQNITLHQIPCVSSGLISSRIEYMFQVRRLFRRLQKDHNFDLIHQLNPVFTGVSLSFIGTRVPLILGTYAARWPDDPDSIASQPTWISRGFALGRAVISGVQQRYADAIVLTTPAAHNRLPHLNAVRDRIYTLPYGVDASLFCPEIGWDSATRLSADQENPSILFFANVVLRKGIFTLIEAFSTVAREIPNSVLRIAGDGPELPEAERRVAALSCADRIEFLGRQDRAQAPALYRNCSVYCLPSLGEPYGMTAVEAMACAKPVVVTDAGGLAHLVHERGGKRVPVGDPVSLANALIDLLRDPVQRLAMGRYNRKLVETTMTWEQVVQQLEEIYFQTLERAAEKLNGKRRSEPSASDRTSVSRVQERV